MLINKNELYYCWRIEELSLIHEWWCEYLVAKWVLNVTRSVSQHWEKHHTFWFNDKRVACNYRETPPRHYLFNSGNSQPDKILNAEKHFLNVRSYNFSIPFEFLSGVYVFYCILIQILLKTYFVWILLARQTGIIIMKYEVELCYFDLYTSI